MSTHKKMPKTSMPTKARSKCSIVKGFLGPAAAGSTTSAKVAAAAGPSWQLHRSSISRVSETHGLKRKHHQVMWFDVVIFFGKPLEPWKTMEKPPNFDESQAKSAS